MSMRVERARTSEQYENPGEASPSQPQPPPEAKLGAGSAALVSRHEASRRKSSGAAGQDRIDTARGAMQRLAAGLPGHGVDVDALAASFGTAKYEAHDKSKIASQATYTFVRAALQNQPGLADRAIAMRMSGGSGTDREIVELGLSRRGSTGLVKYAECERMLGALRAFDAEQRKDIAGLMRAGASFDSAVAEEKKALQEIEASAKRPAAPSLAAQRAASVKRVQSEANVWKQVSRHMNTAIRSVPKLDRAAEAAVGAGVGAGSVGSIVYGGIKSDVTRNDAHLRRAVRDAENAGGYMAGELTRKIAQADRLFVEFSAQHVKYAEQSARLSRAIQSGDYPTINDASARMKTLANEMKSTVKAFDALATKIGEMNREFDAAAAHAAMHLALTAISGAHGGHAVQGVGHVVEEGLRHSVQEAAVMDLLGHFTH